MCPADTPEGEACGLVKNLALLAHVTNDEECEDNALLEMCYDLGLILLPNRYNALNPLYVYTGTEDCSILTGDEIHSPESYIIFLNGLIVGIHLKPNEFVDKVLKLN